MLCIYFIAMDNCHVLYIKGREMVISMHNAVNLRTKVYSKDGKRIGSIVKILGPVSSPYGIVGLDGSIDPVDEVYIK